MKLLENKTALITGASRGIGRSHALLFAEEGANIIFTDLQANENSESLLAELRAKGVRADFVASNAADFAQAQEVAASTCWSTTPALPKTSSSFA